MLFMLFLISVPHVLYLLQQAVDKRVYCYFPVKDSVGQIQDGIKSRMNGDSALMNSKEPCAVFSFKCRPSKWHIGCLSLHRSTQDFWNYCDPFILGYTYILAPVPCIDESRCFPFSLVYSPPWCLCFLYESAGMALFESDAKAHIYVLIRELMCEIKLWHQPSDFSNNLLAWGEMSFKQLGLSQVLPCFTHTAFLIIVIGVFFLQQDWVLVE